MDRQTKTVREALDASKIVLMVVINDDSAKIRVFGKTYEVKEVIKHDCKCRWDGENKEWYRVVSLENLESVLAEMLADIKKGARKFAKIDESDVNAYNLPTVDKAAALEAATKKIEEAKESIKENLATVAIIAESHNQSASDAVAYHCLATLADATGGYDVMHNIRKAMYAHMAPTPAPTVSLGSGISKYVAPNAATWSLLSSGERATLVAYCSAPNKDLFLRSLTWAANAIADAVTKIRKLDAKLAASTLMTIVNDLMAQYCPNVKI